MPQGNDKRKKILAAAEAVMSAKGLADSSISEIAGLAGVADSVIYQFFKGKEDLLFSIPAERMQDVLNLLQEQLTGILDPVSRLRKMIWFHLRYNDTHRGYARLLLLECRSSKDFYSTPAYQLIRRYAGIITGILEQGKAEGVFRADLNLRLARGCILGAMDMENISSLGSGEITNSEEDFEGLASLVQAMLAPRPEPDSSKRNKAEAILQAAVKVFAEKGFNRAKISDIAALAGVADGTVYEYFENKEDLLMSIPVKRFDRYLDNLWTAFEIRDPLRKLRRLIKYHFASFLIERDFSKIFVLQLQHNRRFFGSKAFESQRRYFQFIEDLIREGQEQGVFRQDVVPRVFRNMFLGTFNHMALRWLIIQESSDTDKLSEINQVTDLLCDAVLPEGVRHAWGMAGDVSGADGAGPEMVD